MQVRVDDPHADWKAAVAAAEQGEDVQIVDETGRVAARMVADGQAGQLNDSPGTTRAAKPAKRQLGWARGSVVYHEGWDDSLEALFEALQD